METEQQSKVLIEEIKRLLNSVSYSEDIEVQLEDEYFNENSNVKDMFIMWTKDPSPEWNASHDTSKYDLYLMAYIHNGRGGDWMDCHCDQMAPSSKYLEGLKEFKAKALGILEDKPQKELGKLLFDMIQNNYNQKKVTRIIKEK